LTTITKKTVSDFADIRYFYQFNNLPADETMKALLSPEKTFLVRIEWLNWAETVATGEYAGYATSGNISSDVSKDCRRSFNATFLNASGLFIPNGSLTNMGVKLRLSRGIVTASGQEWWQKGIFVLTDPEALHRGADKTVSLQGLDKWSLLDGTLGGTLTETYQIPSGTNVATAIRAVLTAAGETKFRFDACSTTTPYTITKEPGETYADLIKELALIPSYELFYDTEGYMVFRPIIDPVNKPVAYNFSKHDHTKDPTFSRNSVAYKQDGNQVASGVPRFESGKFDQAVMVEEGTTNVLLYSEQFDNAAWNKNNASVIANATVSPDGATTADTLTDSSTTTYGEVEQSVVIPGTAVPWEFSVYVKKDTITTRFPEFALRLWSGGVTAYEAYVQLNTNTGATIFRTSTGTVSATVQDMGGYWRIAIMVTNVDQTTAIIRICPAITSTFGTYEDTATGSIVIWGAQLEQKAYATTYMATTSAPVSRSPETLTIPTAGVLNASEGMVECWVRFNTLSGYRQIFGVCKSGTGWIGLQSYGTALRFQFYYPTNVVLTGPTLSTNTWYHIALTWSGTTAKLFLDGILQATATIDAINGFASVAYIGANRDGIEQLNGLIDDLRISSRARTDAEILAAYSSGVALAVDADTTYKFTADGILENTSFSLFRKLYVAGSYKPEWSKIKNLLKVIGYSDSGTGTTYTGTAQDNNPNSPTNTATPPTGIGVKAEVITDTNLTSNALCASRADYELKKNLKSWHRTSASFDFVPFLREGECIQLEDADAGIADAKYEIQAITEPLGLGQYSVECWRVVT